jgi:hypothetical protein
MAGQFRPHVDPPRPDFDALEDTDLEIPTISVPEGTAPVSPPQPATGTPKGGLDAAAQFLDPTASLTDTGDMPAPPPPPPPGESVIDDLGRPFGEPVSGGEAAGMPPAADPPSEPPPATQPPLGRGDEGGAEGSDSGLEIPTISVPGAIPRDESDPFGTGASPAPPAVRIPRPTDLIGLIGAFSPPMAVALVAMLILAGAGWALTRPDDVAPATAPNANTPAGSAAPAPAAAAAQTATPTARRTTAASYRVTGLPAKYSGACGDLTVTWAWTIDGLGDSGNYMIRYQRRDGASYLAETGPFTLRPGTTGAQTWDPATGCLELIEKGTQILRAEITQVLNRPVTGAAVSSAPPPPC